jgi:hypothetical protein
MTQNWQDQIRMMIVKLGNHFPIRVLDWFVAGVTLSWGIVCLNVGQATWDLPIYDPLRLLAPQGAWGAFAVMMGLSRMTALFINGAYRRTPHTRMVGAFLTTFMWLQLSFAMFQGEYHAIAATAIYPWLFLADIYNVYRAAQDAKSADSVAKQGLAGDAYRTAA